MSRKQNWYVRRYVRAVSGFLPCSGKVKEPLLDTLRAQAEEYIADGGDAAELEQRLGTPQQVAAAWVDEMEMPELLKALRSRRRVVLTVLAGVIAALAVWLAVCMVSLRDYHQAVDGHVETIVTEVDN